MLKALAAQDLAGMLVWGGWTLAAGIGFKAPLAGLLAVQGILAAVFGHFFGLRRWWAPIHVLLPAAVAVVLAWRLPAWVPLIAFLALLGIFWNSARGGVPLYLSNRKTKEALACLLPTDDGFHFADLGCGLGGPVIGLSSARPKGRFTGFETAPLLFAVAWLRLRFRGTENAEIRFADI